MKPNPRSLAIPVAAAAVALALTGCGRRSSALNTADQPAATTQPEPVTTETFTVPTTVRATSPVDPFPVLHAFHAYLNARVDALEANDPYLPGIAATTTGTALDNLHTTITKNRSANTTVDYLMHSNSVEIADITIIGDIAFLTACYRSMYRVTLAGQRPITINDMAKGTQLQVELARQGGTWLVSDAAQLDACEDNR